MNGNLPTDIKIILGLFKEVEALWEEDSLSAEFRMNRIYQIDQQLQSKGVRIDILDTKFLMRHTVLIVIAVI